MQHAVNTIPKLVCNFSPLSFLFITTNTSTATIAAQTTGLRVTVPSAYQEIERRAYEGAATVSSEMRRIRFIHPALPTKSRVLLKMWRAAP